MKTAKKVALNTVIMYVQLIMNVLIGLISVRLILKALGHSDYGLYDLIGGIVGLLSFISNSLAQSSMRFISVSLGKKDLADTNRVFNSCFWLHIFIALILCTILEVVGLFIFDGYLNIPDGRVGTAKIIFHCMVVSLFIKINSSPMSALITSYEDFWYKALVSITDSLLKLVIAVIITYHMNDKLLLYGILMVCITLINYSMYYIYCRTKFKPIIILHKPSKGSLKPLVGFAGWTLLDTFSSVINRQGYSVLLNKFFGTTMNASFAVSRQLEGHMFSVSSSVVSSMKPQIMKSHGANDDARMFRLSMTAGKFGFYMMSLIIIPLLFMMPDVLDLWLENVPENAAEFSKLLLIACMAEQLTRGLVYANQAVGNIKWFSIVVSTMRILALPASWVFLHYGSTAWVAIFVFMIFETIGSFCRIIILSKITDFRIKDFVNDVFIRIIPPTIVALLFCYLVYPVKSGVVWMIVVTLASCVIYAVSAYFIGLTKEEKKVLQSLVSDFFSKFTRH